MSSSFSSSSVGDCVLQGSLSRTGPSYCTLVQLCKGRCCFDAKKRHILQKRRAVRRPPTPVLYGFFSAIIRSFGSNFGENTETTAVMPSP